MRIDHYKERIAVSETPSARDSLDRVIEAILRARRMGAEVDLPEGERYAMFSDTLLNEFVRLLQGVRRDLLDRSIEREGLTIEQIISREFTRKETARRCAEIARRARRPFVAAAIEREFLPDPVDIE